MKFLAAATLAVSAHGIKVRQEPNAATTQAMQRVAAVEDMKTSHVICRIASASSAVGDLGAVTVRLHTDNSRSIAFNDDTSGFESKVKCNGPAPASCLSGNIPTAAASIDECPACPCEGTDGNLFGPYSQSMAQEVEARCGSKTDGSSLRVLQLGLGAGELAAHLKQGGCEGLQMDAVELDPRLPQLARKYFGLSDDVHVEVGDAGPAVRGLQQAVEDDKLLADQKKYDVILADCFSSGGVTPEHCRSEEFEHAIHVLLRDGGRVMQHLWRTDPDHAEVPAEHDATVELYKKEYACEGCSVDVRSVGEVDDLVVASLPAAAASD